MNSNIITRGGWLLLAAIILISTACTYDPPGNSDLDGSLADDGIEFSEARITMPDGVRLAADLLIPESSNASTKYPVLLDYLPYRKNESRSRNYSMPSCWKFELDRIKLPLSARCHSSMAHSGWVVLKIKARCHSGISLE
jgi:predicted acyl esterase